MISRIVQAITSRVHQCLLPNNTRNYTLFGLCQPTLLWVIKVFAWAHSQSYICAVFNYPITFPFMLYVGATHQVRSCVNCYTTVLIQLNRKSTFHVIEIQVGEIQVEIMCQMDDLWSTLYWNLPSWYHPILPLPILEKTGIQYMLVCPSLITNETLSFKINLGSLTVSKIYYVAL